MAFTLHPTVLAQLNNNLAKLSATPPTVPGPPPVATARMFPAGTGQLGSDLRVRQVPTASMPAGLIAWLNALIPGAQGLAHVGTPFPFRMTLRTEIPGVMTSNFQFTREPGGQIEAWAVY